MMKMILALLFQGVMPMFLGFGANPALQQFKSEQGVADAAASRMGSAAATQGAQLNNLFTQEINAKHSLDPNQQNELLTNALSGAGGAFGGAEGLMNANAARTGNATTLTKSLDEMARDKAKSAAGASEGIAGQDIMGAKQLNQQGAQGLQGLYGTNTQGQLEAMKNAQADIQGEMAANPGWLKSTLGTVADLSNAAGNFMTGLGKAEGN